MTQHRRFALVGILLATLVSAETRRLTQSQLVDHAAVLDQYHRAHHEDHAFAKKALDDAQRAVSQNRWGAAFKAYGEASLVAPSVDSLLGLSLSIANVARPRGKCSEALQAKLKDVSLATQYLGVATALLQHIDPTSLDAWNKIGNTFHAVLDVHRRLLERQDRCRS